MKCPKCKSENITVHENDGLSFITCKACEYDELEEFYPSERESQREKAKHSPYKAGGKGRSRRK